MSINGERLKNSICVGEILYSHEHFSEVLGKGLVKRQEQLSMVPVKIVVKRLSNYKVIDLLGIKRIELNKKKLAFGLFALRIRHPRFLLITEIFTN